MDIRRNVCVRVLSAGVCTISREKKDAERAKPFLNVLDRESKRVLLEPQHSTARLSHMKRYVRSLVYRPRRFCWFHEHHPSSK